MTAQEDLAQANRRPDDLLAAILEDHAEIKQLFAAVDDAATTAERDELGRLRKENRELRTERDILKKAAAFFAKHQA